MLIVGLLWYDDDARRPVAQKIADAVARYQERLGGRPTVCQLNPRQAATLTAAKAATVPQVRLMPDETLRPNYFLVGIEEGDELPRAAPEPEGQPAAHDTPTVRKPRRARAPTPATTPRPAMAEDAPPAAPAARAPIRRRRSGAALPDAPATAPIPAPAPVSSPVSRTRRGVAPARAVPPSSPTSQPRPAPRSGRRAAAPSPSVIQLEMPLPEAAPPHSGAPHRRRAS
jgi:hypothetical protein